MFKNNALLTNSCGLPRAVSLMAVIPVPKVAPGRIESTSKEGIIFYSGDFWIRIMNMNIITRMTINQVYVSSNIV